jgi:SAM-dependent methyltransferase
MTVPEHDPTTIWKDAEFAQRWAASDGMRDMLVLPRRMAAALVARERPDAKLVIDVGSGPGTFLEAFLEELTGASGLWIDASEAMREQARERLAPFGDRVSYRIADLANLDAAGLPEGADALISSRAQHHVKGERLVGFYRSAAACLAPGGWLVNLDHTGPSSVWDQRFRAVRKRFIGAGSDQGKHPHNYPFSSVAEHLDAFASAGIDDVELVWKAFYTCLFMGRKAG